jgi:hypothetical protein
MDDQFNHNSFRSYSRFPSTFLLHYLSTKEQLSALLELALRSFSLDVASNTFKFHQSLSIPFEYLDDHSSDSESSDPSGSSYISVVSAFLNSHFPDITAYIISNSSFAINKRPALLLIRRLIAHTNHFAVAGLNHLMHLFAKLFHTPSNTEFHNVSLPESARTSSTTKNSHDGIGQKPLFHIVLTISLTIILPTNSFPPYSNLPYSLPASRSPSIR